MGIVAVNARIAGAAAAGQVPVSVHSAMQALVVIPTLWPVALRAKSHAVGEIQCAAICQAQGFVVVGIVAAQAGEIAMVVFQALMELIQVLGAMGGQVRLGSRVTGAA